MLRHGGGSMHIVDRFHTWSDAIHRKYGAGAYPLALKSRLLPFSSTTRIRPPGAAHPLRVRTHSSDLQCFHQIFVAGELDLPLAGAPQTILDAGANVGLAAVFLANRYPEAHVLAIEPEAGNFRLLESNVAPYPRVTALRRALWRADEVVRIVDPGHGAWGFQVQASRDSRTHRPVGEVDGSKLETLLAEQGWQRVDLLKIDIEGAEVEVFAGAASWIDRIGVLVIETHDHLRPGCRAQILRAVGDFDYELERGEHIAFARARFVEDGAHCSAPGWRPRHQRA